MQQPLIGFLLASTAAIMWSLLPIALQPILTVMNTQTIVWLRFVVATIGIFFLLLLQGKLPKFKSLTVQQYKFMLLGILGLGANFYLFNLSLNYITPTAAQVLSPLTSFAMLFSGILLFKERFGLHQKIGLALLLIGLPLFFNDRFADFTQMNSYSIGILLSVNASFIWVCYGIAQKILLKHLSSQQILLVIYFGSALVFTPMADISQINNLSNFTLACLIFCCVNTIIAYGCYAEALNRWEIAKVSMIMPQITILTLFFSQVAHWLDPKHFPASNPNFISYIGAIAVVLGALSAAAGHKILYHYAKSRNDNKKK
ncbi:drug/metabolite transporter (DMT)-like permease [Vespertiliibacter pulmonis]|uniref:Drug/metabolite transporter (DMT)-like permease n=1 Tax=Vespertiliibacter pulmonis TaxID=1443036 RepID=A0A3N4VM34_9PAST|nr:DMT family transporter [Vespertiliibacter pulmonis]RPE82743.1 drug/metabolite transporter (DMT)-like permease [Vespertiliibacter pulmonis]